VTTCWATRKGGIQITELAYLAGISFHFACGNFQAYENSRNGAHLHAIYMTRFDESPRSASLAFWVSVQSLVAVRATPSCFPSIFVVDFVISGTLGR